MIRVSSRVVGWLAVLAGPALASQNLPVGLARMSSALSGMQRYNVAVTVRVADSAGHPILARIIHAARDKNAYLYRFDSSLALVTPTGTVLVDRARRIIAYSPSSNSSAEHASPPISPDSLLRAVDSVVTLPPEGPGTHYRVFAHNGPIPEAEILVDEDRHLPRQVAYKYVTGENGDAHVSITYDWGPLVAMGDSMRIERYVIIKADAVEPAQGLLGYRVIRGTSR